MINVPTAYGGYVDLANPIIHTITLKDIAFALSNTARFGGHTQFYSVAQHSVLMARMLREEGQPNLVCASALMHDAHEAYVGDITEPVRKALGSCNNVLEHIEGKLSLAIRLRFRLPKILPSPVYVADEKMLVTEAQQLLPREHRSLDWPEVTAYDINIYPWISERALYEFQREASRCDVY